MRMAHNCSRLFQHRRFICLALTYILTLLLLHYVCLCVCLFRFIQICALNLLSVPIVHCRMEYPQWKTATIYLNDFGTTQYLQLSF